MPTPIRQASFAAGEISPELQARDDIERYKDGLGRCRNFYVGNTGHAISRPGTVYLGEAGTVFGPIRLVPFGYSETDAFVLEFGAEYVRFWTADGQVQADAGGPYEVATPYVDDLDKLKFAQVGNVITITHPAYAPMELRRVNPNAWGPGDWTLTAVGFVPPALTDVISWTGLSATEGGPYISAAASTITTEDSTHFAREWGYRLTAIVQRLSDGVVFETLPFTVARYRSPTYPVGGDGALPGDIVLYADRPLTLVWHYATVAGYAVKSFRISRGRGELFGYIGETLYSAAGLGGFVDIAEAPDYTRQPPKGSNPFQVLNPDQTVNRTEMPAAVTFFQQRRVFGNSYYGGVATRPSRIWGSAVDRYSDFDKFTPSVESQAYEFELASQKAEEVRSLVGDDALLAVTQSRVWTVRGPGDEPLAADAVDARGNVKPGGSWIQPIVVGDTCIYVEYGGGGVRQILFSNERRKYVATDLSLYSQHLMKPTDDFLTDGSIKDWAHVEHPFSVVWATRGDGKLLSLTYEPDQQLVAWGWHDTEEAETEGGIFQGFESVCVLPGALEDVVFFSVRRVIAGEEKVYIERFATRDIAAVADSVCVDASVTVEGSGITSISTLSHLEHRDVYGVADGVPFGPVTVHSGTISIPKPGGANKVTVGLPFFPELEQLDAVVQGQQVRSNEKNVTGVEVEVKASTGFYAGPDADHLEPWESREVADSYGAIPLKTKKATLDIDGDWNTTGRVFIRQVDPLPLTVLAITRKVDFGDVDS